jgi:hypothetical protein
VLFRLAGFVTYLFRQAPGGTIAVEVFGQVAEAVFYDGLDGQATASEVIQLVSVAYKLLVGMVYQGGSFLLPFFGRGFGLVDDGAGGPGLLGWCCGGQVGAIATATAAFVPHWAFQPLTDYAEHTVGFGAGLAFDLTQEADRIGVKAAGVAVAEVISDVDHKSGGVV